MVDDRLGEQGAAVMDPEGEVDIVEHALAILDEEWRTWVARQRGLTSREEVVPAPVEPPEGQGGDGAK